MDWIPFLPRLVSQSAVGTSLDRGDGRLWHGWRVLFTARLRVYAQDVLEPLAEWFYAIEYITLVSPAFRDLNRRIVVIFFNSYNHSVITPLRLPDYRN